MARCSFQFEFPIRADELIQRIDSAIRGAGGDFDGDSASGFYSVPTPLGTIEGSYNVTAQTIQIDVLEKPSMLSCQLIEKQLNDMVRRAESSCP